MKSKVTFDLNADNSPIIKAIIEYSEDVRDKIAKRFKEGFGHSSNLAIVKFTDEPLSITSGGLVIDFGSTDRSGLELLPLRVTEQNIYDDLSLISTKQLEFLKKAFSKELTMRKDTAELIESK